MLFISMGVILLRPFMISYLLLFMWWTCPHSPHTFWWIGMMSLQFLHYFLPGPSLVREFFFFMPAFFSGCFLAGFFTFFFAI